MVRNPVYLWDWCGIIILDDNGIYYTNQTGGLACRHPVVRGYFIPLSCSDYNNIINDLQTTFYDYSPFTELDKKKLQSILKNSPFSIDEENFNKSEEAWIYVIVKNGFEFGKFDSLVGFQGKRGIITYENSD